MNFWLPNLSCFVALLYRFMARQNILYNFLHLRNCLNAPVNFYQILIYSMEIHSNLVIYLSTKTLYSSQMSPAQNSCICRIIYIDLFFLGLWNERRKKQFNFIVSFNKIFQCAVESQESDLYKANNEMHGASLLLQYQDTQSGKQTKYCLQNCICYAITSAFILN